MFFKRKEYVETHRVPLFESKKQHGVYYYLTIGFTLDKKDIERGINSLLPLPMKYASFQTYENREDLPQEVIDDIPELNHFKWIDRKSETIIDIRKSAFFDFYGGGITGKEAVTLYKLKKL